MHIDDESSGDDNVLVEVNGQGRKYKGQTMQCDNYEIDMETDAPQIELDQVSDSEYVGTKKSSHPKKTNIDTSKKKSIQKPLASHFTSHLKTKGRPVKGQTEHSDNSDTDMELDEPQIEQDNYSDSEYEAAKSSKRPNKHKALERLKQKPKKKRAVTHVTPYPCNYCGKEIIGKWHLESHIKRVHLKTKDSPCQICPKRFFNSPELESHMLSVHTRLCQDCNEYVVETERWPEGTDMSKIRYVTCQCGAQVTVRNKKERRREHEDDPGHLNSADVRTYKRNDQNQFSCTHCGKLFRSKAHCLRHARMHTGVKDIHCDYCDETFRYQGSLKKHLQKEHRIFSYPCDYCRETFSSKNDLEKHLSRKHTVEHVRHTSYKNQTVTLENQGQTLFTGAIPHSSPRKLLSITQHPPGMGQQEPQGLGVRAPQNPVVAVSGARAPQNPIVSGVRVTQNPVVSAVRAPQNPVVAVSVADGESLDSITYNIVQQVLQGNDQVFTEDGKTIIIRTVHE